MNKIVEVHGFSLYWDVIAPMVSTYSSDEIQVVNWFCSCAFLKLKAKSHQFT